jgi:hypothetical protein
MSLRTAEIRADFCVVISAAGEVLPFQLDDASRLQAADLADLGDLGDFDDEVVGADDGTSERRAE